MLFRSNKVSGLTDCIDKEEIFEDGWGSDRGSRSLF